MTGDPHPAASGNPPASRTPAMPESWTPTTPRPPEDREPQTGRLVVAAEEAVSLSGADPGRARERASAVLVEAEARGHAEAASVAHRALALTAREFGDLELAAEHLRLAVAAARDLPERAAQARLSLVTVRADLGDPEGGLRVADLAERHLTGLDRHRLGVQRAVALVRLGRTAEAVARCDRAIEGLTGSGDARFLAGALVNRGIAHAYLEHYDEASRDLSACLVIARDAGLDHLAVLAQANIPFVAARRGDIPAAYAGYQAAERELTGYPERLAVMRADFAEALLAAHLPGEARAQLARAVPELAMAGARGALAESRLLLAELELLVGDPHQAKAGAELAAREFTSQGRDAWLPLAEEVVLRARLAERSAGRRPTGERPGQVTDGRQVTGEPIGNPLNDRAGDRRLLDELRELGGRLAWAGWTGQAAALRLTAAELALTLGDRARAEAELRHVIATDPAGRTHRLVRHHATALERDLHGDRPAAIAALRAGLAEVTSGGERLTDPGVRAHAARAGERLAEFGLSLALADGRPEVILGWAEHCRALTRKPASDARPEDAALTETLREALEGAALVEFVRHGDRLAAVVVTADRHALRELGSYAAAAEATVRVRYGLRRAGLRDTHALNEVAAEAERLGAHLLGPLAGDIGDRPLVIVPTGALHTLPWPVLPACHGRPLCVASSAIAWLTTATRRPGSRGAETSPLPVPAAAFADPSQPAPHVTAPEHHMSESPGARVVAVAGPELRYADAEAAMVVRAHAAGARPPSGGGNESVRVRAVRGDVLGALEYADVLHVAAHGTFRVRSPLLSSITLEDGPLMAYDLLRHERTPPLVILSACDTGMAHAPVDGAPLGLAGAFLDQGTACVVAGLVPVRDDEALTLMTAFHALLTSGHTPAEALATASRKTGVDGFACFGSLGHPI
ncbi:CHAT domain-containing protein [Sphaerisporangium sp. NPDC051011]|uniref:CHAT domain-containing protein n=1 Tax=Sphaerisporangium sp. NPDC051011 TaxID=3155792 RepID=UPI0033EA5497